MIQYNIENGIARINLDHPPVNVIHIALMKELNTALEDVKSSDAKIVILGATGKLFSAGVDVADHTEDKVDEMIKLFHQVIRNIWALPQPVLCVVQGTSLGGGMELALACDFVVSADQAKFGQPEVQVGVFPPIAALVLPKLTSRQFALESVLLGQSYSAQRLYELGLINEVVPADQLEQTIADWTEKLMSLSGPVLQYAKKATLMGWNQDQIEATLNEIEELYLGDLMKLNDAKEGLEAFMEKRKPEWKES